MIVILRVCFRLYRHSR